MTNAQLGALIDDYAEFYWSASAEFVLNQIKTRHPEVTDRQINGVLKEANTNPFKFHWCLLLDGLEEPEITAEHLIAVDINEFDQFLAARIAGPYCEHDEKTLHIVGNEQQLLDIPEVKAILAFGKNELGLDDEWARQLLMDCRMSQAMALCNGESWVETVLSMERFGKIHFKTIQQVRRFRALGSSLFQALPNPVLKGWRPADLPSCPALPDDIPEKDEDIPDDHEKAKAFVSQLRAHFDPEALPPRDAPQRTPRRNDPCPCGSGKKYKNCCGR